MCRLLDYCKEYIITLFVVIFHSPKSTSIELEARILLERFGRTDMIQWVIYVYAKRFNSKDAIGKIDL